jgi:hypothetical protein
VVVITFLFALTTALPLIAKAQNGKQPLIDSDGDKLWDYEERIWGTDPNNPDTDGDGYKDKTEIINGFDPLKPRPIRLPKWIRIDLSKQTLSYGYGPKVINNWLTSTGKRGFQTPTGTFKILNKRPLAYSRQYKLYMPYWMAFTPQGNGIHELPYWKSGYREGANHLGKPVSHGCVRLGIGPAKELYDWAEIGTRVVVEK